MYVTTIYRIILTALLIVFSCNQIHAAEQLDDVTIQLKWTHQFQFAGYYAALEKGYYAEEGLDVSFRERKKGEDYIKPVLDGDAEYGVASSSLLIHRLNGKPVVLLAQIFQSSAMVAVARGDSEISSPDDMVGKRVEYDKTTYENAPLIAILQDKFGSVDDVKFVHHSYQLDKLLTGDVDVSSYYVSTAPYIMKQKGIDANIIDPRDYGITFYGDNLFTSDEEIDNHPKRAEKVRRATIKGWRYALEHPDEIIDLIIEKYAPHLERKRLEYEARVTVGLIQPDIVPVGKVVLARFERILETYRRLGLTKATELPLGFVKDFGQSVSLTPEERGWLQQEAVVRLSIDGYNPPLNFRQSDDRLTGITLDYLDLIAKKLGITFQYESDRWKDVLNEAMVSNTHGIANVQAVKEFGGQYAFSEPYMMLDYGLFAAKEYGTVHSLDELNDFTIALKRGTNGKELVAERTGDKKILETDSDWAALKQVFSGRADAAVIPVVVGQYVTDKYAFTGIGQIFALGHDEKSSLRIGVRDAPLLLSSINKAIAAISPSERLHIETKWQTVVLAGERHAPLNLTVEERLWLADHPLVKMAFTASWPPFDLTSDSGEYYGFNADYIDLLNERLGIHIVPTVFDYWADALQAGEEGTVESIGSITKTAASEKLYYFTEPYVTNPIVAVSSNNGPKISSWTDLEGKRVLATRGSVLVEKVKSQLSRVNFVTVDDEKEGLRQVEVGQGDVYLGLLGPISHEIERSRLNNLDVSLMDTTEDAKLRFAIHKEYPLFASALQKAVSSVSVRELDRVKRRWLRNQGQAISYHAPDTPEVVKRQTSKFVIWTVIAIVLLLLPAITYFLAAHRRGNQLQIRTIFWLNGFTFVSLILGITIFAALLHENEQGGKAIQAQKHMGELSAEELRETSRNLTDSARAFIATGDLAYAGYYWEIRAILNGEQAHTRFYQFAYWYQRYAKLVPRNISGEKYSIWQRLEGLDLTSSEREELERAKVYLKEMENLETEAIAVYRTTQLNDHGSVSFESKTNAALAWDLLYGREYLEASAKFMITIDRFLDLLQWRVGEEINQLHDRSHAVMVCIRILILFTLFFAIVSFSILRRRVITPLSVLHSAAQSFNKGKETFHVQPSAVDEIGNLTIVFNSMVRNVKERMSRLHAIIESATDAILAVDLDRRITAYNQQFLELWEIDPAVLDDPKVELTDLVVLMEQRLIGDEKVKPIRHFCVTSDEENFIILLLRNGRVLECSSRLQRLDDSIIGQVYSFRDIAGRVNDEKLLLQRADRLKKAQSVARLGSWEFDVLNHELSCSDEFYKLLGYPIGAFDTLDSFIQRVHPDDRSVVEDIITSVKECSLKDYEVEYRAIHKVTGEVIYIHERAEIALDEDRVVTYMSGYVQDITERKKNQLLIESQNYRLNLLQKILSNSHRPTRETLQSIIKECCKIFGMDDACIDHIEDDKRLAEYRFPDISLPHPCNSLELCTSCCSRIVLKEQVLMIDDLQATLHTESLCFTNKNFQAFAGVMIKTTYGDYGILRFTSANPRSTPFTDHDYDFLQLIAGVCGSILDQILGRQKLVEHADELAEFNKAMIDRELRIIELKEEVNAMARRSGQPQPYEAVWAKDVAMTGGNGR